MCSNRIEKSVEAVQTYQYSAKTELDLPNSLVDLIENKQEYIAVYKSFEMYLDTMYASENLLFLSAIHDYFANPNSRIFLALFKNFVMIQALFWVNLSAKTYLDLEQCYQKHLSEKQTYSKIVSLSNSDFATSTTKQSFVAGEELDDYDDTIQMLCCKTKDALKLAWDEIVSDLNAGLWRQFEKTYAIAAQQTNLS